MVVTPAPLFYTYIHVYNKRKSQGYPVLFIEHNRNPEWWEMNTQITWDFSTFVYNPIQEMVSSHWGTRQFLTSYSSNNSLHVVYFMYYHCTCTLSS